MIHREELARTIAAVVEPAAYRADQLGRFPREAVKALGRKGILGMTASRRLGGGGGGLADASRVVEQVAASCAGTATVLRSHFSAVAVLEAHADFALRKDIASGQHLSTLALFDAGPDRRLLSPTGTAWRHGGVVDLNARKAWVISAGEADSYVWSSRPLGAHGPATLWLVPGYAPGLLVPADHGGIGLRASSSTTVCADPVQVPEANLLGVDGDATDAVLDLALPWFLGLGAAVALGLMEGAIAAARAQADGRGARTELARMRLRADAVRVLHDDALGAFAWHPGQALHKLFQLALASAEGVVAVTDLAMKLCEDAAFRRDVGIERRFRDARASCAIEPTVETVLEFAAR
ncbi:acyl-CoA dehydrogenase family protein [Amycolatopsis sp. H20-H5]|uniref:acyl-CoA dehydrogenase family protein n=1 Tax=Amycolatopsis sp. H20-H5 TaxID=3046309 RepID=UPI002DBC0E78|nr:acyl-CoA dehydrogenase family protein [Amycolatopsis sp. H20-H5]MEC3980465.1 acyl-CoA dehydrogenase family protein [Amycolatopsis sp. H20-H5]